MLPGPSVMSRRRTCASGRTLRRATVCTGTVLAAQWLMAAHVDGKLHMIFSSCTVNRPAVTHSAFHFLSGPFPSVVSHPGFEMRRSWSSYVAVRHVALAAWVRALRTAMKILSIRVLGG